jgi:hypothetical protein
MVRDIGKVMCGGIGWWIGDAIVLRAWVGGRRLTWSMYVVGRFGGVTGC